MLKLFYHGDGFNYSLSRLIPWIVVNGLLAQCASFRAVFENVCPAKVADLQNLTHMVEI
jgi:hypothetical protein